MLAWDGAGEELKPALMGLASKVLDGGHLAVIPAGELQLLAAGDGGRTLTPEVERAVVIAPIKAGARVVGVVAAFAPAAGAGLVRATGEVADWVATQVELAELDASRTLLMEAEVRALRAQISPHFIYNSLNAIASFINTDPVRARELVVEFADFTRYSFRRHGDFTTLAEELRCIDRYLLLERARFGDRVQVSLRIAPEVLSTVIPFLSLQPLVENAVRHGLEAKEGAGPHLHHGERLRRVRGSDDRGRRRGHGPGRSCAPSLPGTATASTWGCAMSTPACGRFTVTTTAS